MNNKSFEEFKNIIDELISKKEIHKLKLREDYFDICNNYWIVDKYIAKNGQCLAESTPNTLETYQTAIDNSYAICIPVQILDDDNIVCFSSKTLSKVISTANGYVNKLKLNEVKEISLNEQGDKIPTLDEALSFISNKTPIIIDIQNDGMIGKFEDKVLLSLQKYIIKHKCHSNVAIMSTNPYSLQYCFQQFPYITRILKSGAFENKMYGSIPTSKLKKLKYYKITNADFISYSSHLLPNIKISRCKPVGVLAYTITNQNQYLAVAQYCDNIIFSNFKPTI